MREVLVGGLAFLGGMGYDCDGLDGRLILPHYRQKVLQI